VDPQADDINAYVEFVKIKGMEIKYVLDTHIQADHLSGGLRLAQLTGAEYCLHELADVSFDFSAGTDNQDLDLGNVAIRVLHTPGHTPESISVYLLLLSAALCLCSGSMKLFPVAVIWNLLFCNRGFCFRLCRHASGR
jgi:glyoxylase-like metal-dependent hydrolase (beta-lactamase superfamily II)